MACSFGIAVNWQLINCEADDTAPNFFEKDIAVMLYDKVIPFDRSGFVVAVSIKEVCERIPRDDGKPIVNTFSGQASFLTNGRDQRAVGVDIDLMKKQASAAPLHPMVRRRRLLQF